MNEFIIEPGHVDVQWVVNLASDDLSGATDVKAAEDYYRQGILAITVTASVDKEDHWFKILDGDSVMLGPVPITYGVPFNKKFDRPLYSSTGNALRVQTDSAFTICCMVDGHTDVEPDKATEPNPEDEATDISKTATLSWVSTPQIVQHSIYINGELEASQELDSYSASLDYSTTYTWRIDSSDGSTVVTGDTWTFTTEEPPE